MPKRSIILLRTHRPNDVRNRCKNLFLANVPFTVLLTLKASQLSFELFLVHSIEPSLIGMIVFIGGPSESYDHVPTAFQ